MKSPVSTSVVAIVDEEVFDRGDAEMGVKFEILETHSGGKEMAKPSERVIVRFAFVG